MAAGYWDVILITFIGFVALAAILLVPVWRFLSREEDSADRFMGAVRADEDHPGPAWVSDLPTFGGAPEPADESREADKTVGPEV